jgi:septal ring factor EnvC (AmiA/AmiB activator)
MVELAKPITLKIKGYATELFYEDEDIARERANWESQLAARLEELKALQSEREEWQEQEELHKGIIQGQDKQLVKLRAALAKAEKEVAHLRKEWVHPDDYNDALSKAYEQRAKAEAELKELKKKYAVEV